MSESSRESTKGQLAVALAQGVSIAGWARHNEVPRRTAYRWANDPKVRSAVESIRRRTIDRAVGLLSKRAVKAAGGIAALAAEADSESVRLSANRAILADMMTVSKYSRLEERMVKIEEHIRERAGDAGHTG